MISERSPLQRNTTGVRMYKERKYNDFCYGKKMTKKIAGLHRNIICIKVLPFYYLVIEVGSRVSFIFSMQFGENIGASYLKKQL